MVNAKTFSTTHVLLTGASGFIGSGVLRYMLEHTDWYFTCISSWRHRGNPMNVPLSPRVEVITHDLTGPIPPLGQFDYIFNLASESHVDRSIEQPVEFIENNVSSTLQVLEYARKFPPKMFIQFSTDEVYGAHEHEEWDVLLPSNPYAASKAAQEMIATAYWFTYKVPLVITNSNNIVGRNQDKEKFLPKIIDLVSRGQCVQIHQSNGTIGRRFYNPVENVADALIFIAQTTHLDGPNDRPVRYSLPGGEELDNLQLAQMVANTMGKQLVYQMVDVGGLRPAYDHFYAHTEGTLEQRGWRPVTTFQEALPEIIRSYP